MIITTYKYLRTRFLLIFFMLTIISVNTIIAQNPKSEIRAVWVATVSNLDWPYGSNKFDKDQQQATMLTLLDSVKAWNLNTIFLQIRPQSDAFYESQLAPWSEYVSGTRGKSPGYDPLLFAITEAHKRGLELHGWLNPYRYETFVGKNDGKPGDFNATNPEWMLNYEDDRIFNPGVPEVQHHLKDIVGEIINNYDIDGIHFDDYFYPYSGTGSQDQSTFETYGGAFSNIGDWRRNNVNEMISIVYDTIQQIKPYIRFGISPFGIYGNNQDPAGISGLDAYNSIFTDPLQWLSSGNVDYICPQLYWPTGGSQDFATLLPWWAEKTVAQDRHVIAGHGVYRLDDNAATSRQASIHENKRYFDEYNDDKSSTSAKADRWTLSQVALQIDIVRANRDNNALGGAYFRYQDFIRVDGLADYIEASNYGDISIMPAMTWKNQELPTAPLNIHWEEDDKGTSFIAWDVVEPNLRYIIYASEDESPVQTFFDDPANIIQVVYDNAYVLDERSQNLEGKPYIYIAAYDRFGNESANSTKFSIQVPNTASTLMSPVNSIESVSSEFTFSWSSVENAQSYLLEIASSSNFDNTEFSKIILSNSTNAIDFPLLGNHLYHWRITPNNLFGNGPVSEVFSFKTGFPSNPALIYPMDDEELVETLPLIKWSDDGLATSVKLQISKGGSQFETFNIVTDEELGAVNEYRLTQSLNEWTTHHLRLKLINDLGESHWIPASFKTLISLPAAPVIYTPIQDQQSLEEEIVEAKWGKTNLANGYQIKLTSDQSAESIIEEKNVFSANDTTYSYSNLQPGIYYFNVAGNNVGGNGAWSQAKFEVNKILGINNLDSKPKNLSSTISESGSTLIRIDTYKLHTYNLKIYDLYGRNIKLSSPIIKSQNEVIFDLRNKNMSRIGIAVLETDSELQVLKFINNSK